MVERCAVCCFFFFLAVAHPVVDGRFQHRQPIRVSTEKEGEFNFNNATLDLRNVNPAAVFICPNRDESNPMLQDRIFVDPSVMGIPHDEETSMLLSKLRSSVSSPSNYQYVVGPYFIGALSSSSNSRASDVLGEELRWNELLLFFGGAC